MILIIKRYLKIIFLIIVFTTITHSLWANNKPVERHFSKDKIEKIKNDRDFFYADMEENQSDYYDIWGRAFLRFLSNIFGSKPAYFIFSNFNYFLIAIVVLILFFNRKKFIIRRMAGRNRNATGPSIVIEENNIIEIDFSKHISQALNNNNYKLAIRFQYLELLKKLSMAGIIRWEPYKTNYEYFLEIKDSKIRNHYKSVALVFDNIWYGNFEINEADYHKNNHEFEILKEQLDRL